MKLQQEQKRERITALSKDILSDMNGQEIMSISYEDVVYVDGKKVMQGGEVIDKLNTNKKIGRLFDEYIYQEFGSPAQMQKDLEEEFGVIRLGCMGVKG